MNGSQVIGVTFFVCSLAACAATKRGNPADVKFSGFLGDYSQLQKQGGGDEAVYRYVKPGVDLSKYRRLMVDPPQAWVSSEQREKMGDKEIAYVLTALDQAIRERLGAKWELVDRPAPDVLRFRMAITNASATTGALTPFTRIVPWGLLASASVNVATGDYLNNGTITGEMEVVDGETGARLAAGVDQRVGNNSPVNTFSDWGDVKDACTFWAERLSIQLIKYGMKPTK